MGSTVSTALQLGLERYFWAVTLAFLLAGSYLSARTVNLIVAEKIRPLPKANASLAPTSSRQSESPLLSPEAFAKTMGMKLPEAPAPAEATEAEKDKAPDMSSAPVRTSLHSQLLGTALANRPQWSLATIRDLNQNQTSVYMVGDQFMGATVLSIEGPNDQHQDTPWVIVINGGHREFIDNQPSGSGSGTMPGYPAAPPATFRPSDLGAGIRRLDDRHFQIERSTVNNALANLNDLAMQARIVPSFKNGQANGFKLFSIRPDSLYSKIGIQNGDVIQRINGYDMNSPDKALEAYTKLRNAGALDLQIERGGQSLSYHYAIQ